MDQSDKPKTPKFTLKKFICAISLALQPFLYQKQVNSFHNAYVKNVDLYLHCSVHKIKKKTLVKDS